MQKPRFNLKMMIRILLVILLVLSAACFLLSVPPDPRRLVSSPSPVSEYEQALLRIQNLLSEEGADYNPVCRLIFMDHGQKTERVIVFVHGYTNCPEQFRQLGEMFYQQGYNVLITPLPHMGLADRMNTEQENLTAEELATYTDDAIDIAQGLGSHVTLAGLSGGGVMAAWAAQKRSDLDLAVVIAPSFGYSLVPAVATVPMLNLFKRLPNFYQWWDPINQLNITPYYGYPRFSTHALAEVLRMAAIVQRESCRGAPAASSILVITNAGDLSVINSLTDKVVQCWQQSGMQNVTAYQFEASLKLDHDLIDPLNKNQQVNLVYPKLLELIDQLH